MKSVVRHPFRVVERLGWLAAELMLAAVSFLYQVARCRGLPPLSVRARWLQKGCRRVLRIFGAEMRTKGSIPAQGLLVSNHLSYLDILVLSALTPSVFVAKSEVRNWPVFGWFARLGGTMFVDRARRIQVGKLNKMLRTVLDEGVLVTLFPEGTSSDGQTVLPFKSSLLEPATGNNHRVTASLIEYRLADGNAGEEVCYWKDMTFVPHLINLFSKKRIEVSVRFSKVLDGSANRKELALRLHAEVLKLKDMHAIPALN